MKKLLLLVCLPLLLPLPLVAQADVSIDINVPGVSVHLGDQDRRGYYWDGYDWRPPQWWHAHQGRGVGERNSRGLYWDGGRWQPSPPRGNDHRSPERGGNPFHGERDNRNDGNRHDNDHGKGRGNDNDHGKPYPQNGNDPRR